MKKQNNNVTDAWEFENEEEKKRFIDRIVCDNLQHYFFVKNKLEYENRYNSDFNINNISKWDIWYSYNFTDFSDQELESYPYYPH